MLSNLEQSRRKLWADLLSGRQFYAREFLTGQTIGSVSVDFLCPETRFAIRIEPGKSTTTGRQLTPPERKQVEQAGFKLLILSTREILEDFTETVQLIDREFTSLARFRCG
jgi:very-short-patch-repair endonuclease